MKIVLAEVPYTKDRDISVEQSCVPEGAELTMAVFDEHAENNDAFYAEIKDADIIIDGYVHFGKKEIDAMDHCKVISFQSTGYNEADLDYAKEKGIANGEKVRISSARGTVDAVAMVTVRLTPFKCGGKTVHQVGMTFNYGWLQPKECGDTANLLSPMVGDANSMTPEYKAFMVNIDKIKA